MPQVVGRLNIWAVEAKEVPGPNFGTQSSAYAEVIVGQWKDTTNAVKSESPTWGKRWCIELYNSNENIIINRMAPVSLTYSL
jgi:hypothetical protein